MITWPNRRAEWLKVYILVGVIFLILFLTLFLISPYFTRDHGRYLARNCNNGKQLYLALKIFADEHASYPDRTTAVAVRAQTHTQLNLDGDSANDYFRQLIADGIVKTEEPFHTYSARPTTRPDNNMTGAEALKAGEVGWSYLMNGDRAISADEPHIVLACAPVLNPATGEFDPKPFKGKAHLVWSDGSVEMKEIRKDGKVMISEHHTLLDTGKGTIWGKDIRPVIKMPLRQ